MGLVQAWAVHILCCLQCVCRDGPKPTLEEDWVNGWGGGMTGPKPAGVPRSVAGALPFIAPTSIETLASASPMPLICTYLAQR